MDAFGQRRGKPAFDRSADLSLVVARAEVGQDNQLVPEAIRPLDDVVQVGVAEFVDFFLPVFRPEEGHFRDQDLGFVERRIRVQAGRGTVSHVTDQRHPHLVADLERVCDYLVVLVASRVQVAGEIDTLLASHHRVTGRELDTEKLPATAQVIEASGSDEQRSLLIRSDNALQDTEWSVQPVNLEDIVLAYMGRAAHGEGARSSRSEVRP